MNLGRNDPCNCGSGKKFKRCHGLEPAFKPIEQPRSESAGDHGADGGPSPFAGFDPSKVDLNWLQAFSGAMQQLPRGQLQQLQVLMQKAMSGKDVAREMEELQRKLPKSFQDLLAQGNALEKQFEEATTPADSTESAPLTLEQQAQLAQIQKNNQKSGISRLWGKIFK